ncbi:ubiquitin family protein, putative [Rhizoctonia solani AG-3 Rhs1AP]|uniref:Ubiquitin family protein, putative n=1 Tax=Rhizoctonia solani AG-3 Rhs1AP TaxID=1086054 RepID=X8IYF0_9AGAM|nr:ubiquitin family protein, putative [Rhizoctonia solani AG-3 Rhs1AP]
MAANNKSLQPYVKRPRIDSLEPETLVENKLISALLAVEYSDRKVVIRRSASYANTMASIKKAFSQLRNVPDQQIQLFVKLEQLDDLAQVVEDLWEELVPSLLLVKVVMARLPTPSPNNLPGDGIHIIIKICPGIKRELQQRMYPGLPEGGFHLSCNGTIMGDGDTLARHRIENGDEIEVMPIRTGGKPVIYLFSPLPILDVRVQLSLVKAWRFSAIYPPTPITSPSDDSLGEAISWTVDTRPDGSLLDHLTNREVAYLFWEAHTSPKLPISPPTTPSRLLSFDPARPSILPSDSALLPFDKVTGYIDDALLAMELHAEARTSFITYWLPNLSKHTHIAIRFLPQDQYEESAPLCITPAPEITTRVFMLFMGVEESELGAWEAAKVPAEEWSRIVGVDKVKAKDVNLFRALEWGGMEV